MKNFRPVSNLSVFSKLTERAVQAQLLNHLNKNKLFDPHQSAYRAGHSTETALLKVANDLISALDKKHVTILSLLDLSAAFDTIDHTILLQRLERSYGITGTTLAWIESYLKDRNQQVQVKGVRSSATALSYGVPQGSVLGPILFIMYMKPISDLIGRHAVVHESFADDTQLHKSDVISKLPSIVTTMENCILELKDWMTQNKLQFNDQKTELMLLIPPSLKNNPSLPKSMSIGDIEISFSAEVRNLGVIFDQSMSFDAHISQVCKAAYFQLRRISAIRHYLTVDATKTLVCAFVLSKLDYGNSLLAGCYEYQLDKLQRVQNHAARLVLKAKKRQSSAPLLQSLHWLPIRARIKYKVSCMCYAFFSGTGPEYLSDMLKTYSNLTKLRSASDKRQLTNPKRELVSVTFGQRTFRLQGPQIWSTLPRYIRDKETPSSFRSALKTYLFQMPDTWDY